MYLYHFGIKELPFTLTPNTHFYLGLTSHKEALAVLLTALKTGEGFIKVDGEVGTGKTLICRKLLNELPDYFVTAYIPNPYLSPDEMRFALAAELDLQVDRNLDRQQLTQIIQTQLLHINSQGKAVVLVLDEAQALPDETLEALRLFTNIETESRKLLQVVLFAQPELNTRLKQTKFRQLRQRITFSYRLRPMTEKEVFEYIQHRMHCAGSKYLSVFDKSVCKLIAKAGRGIPRLTNVLCHKCLMLCFGQGSKVVKIKDVRRAIADTEDAQPQGHGMIYWLGLSGILATAAAVTSYILIGLGVAH